MHNQKICSLMTLNLQYLACMNMSKRVKGSQKHAPNTGDNIFKLTSIKANCHSQKIDIQIDLDQICSKNRGNPLELSNSSKQMAVINQIFELPQKRLQQPWKQTPVDGEKCSEDGNNLFQNGQSIEADIKKMRDRIYVAIPETNTCFICKQRFQNYFDHIRNEVHKRNQNIQKLLCQKPKLSLSTALKDLIKSINKGDDHSRRERSSGKRQRSIADSDSVSQIGLAPRKRKVFRYETPVCFGSFQSTDILLDKSSLHQKDVSELKL